MKHVSLVESMNVSLPEQLKQSVDGQSRLEFNPQRGSGAGTGLWHCLAMMPDARRQEVE